MGESSSGGAASKGRAAQLTTKKGTLRKGTVGGAAGIPFKSGFRTARGQKSFLARGGKNVNKPGAGKAKSVAGVKSKTQTKKAAAAKKKGKKK